MNHPDDINNSARDLFDRDEVEGVLNGSFYAPSTQPAAAPQSERRPKATTKEKPTHYKVICISMYTDALASLDEKVNELKRRGYTKANRSALIRHALSVLDLDSVPRGI
jgi:hypothetical protein